jgi:hypothetical protein
MTDTDVSNYPEENPAGRGDQCIPGRRKYSEWLIGIMRERCGVWDMDDTKLKEQRDGKNVGSKVGRVKVGSDVMDFAICTADHRLICLPCCPRTA